MSQQTVPQLTGRQLQVLAQIARGRTDNEIAAHLAISPRTVRMHVDALRLKLQVQHRREIFAVYRGRGGFDLLAVECYSRTPGE